jgi:hypothetical protein
MGPQNPAVASLYDTVRDCFTDNELWLPESRSPASKPAEAQATFDVRLSSDDPIRPDQMVWDRERDEGTSDQRAPGRRATRRRRPASALNFVLTGTQWQGADIPDLDVSIWPQTLALDYRPGPNCRLT